jgi:Spc24 subunit of Ndc80
MTTTAMLQSKSKLEVDIATPPATRFIQEQQVLQEKMQNTNKDIAQWEEQVEHSKSVLGDLDQQYQDTLMEKQKAEHAKVTEVPYVRHLLRLYFNVSRIAWNYESKESMKGYVHGEEIVPFDIERDASRSSVDTADMLWNLSATALGVGDNTTSSAATAAASS